MTLRLVSLLFAATILVAAVFGSAHGHLGAHHASPCASCLAASSRATTAAPRIALPTPTCSLAAPLGAATDGPAHRLPPLLSAPKHGPPARA